MNRLTRLASIAAVLSCLTAPSVQAGLQVWTVTETRRVLREDPAEKLSPARLACAGNEWRGFQILVRSDVAIRGICIEPGDLAGPGGAVLASSQSRLFRQHQLHLTDPSYRNDSFRSGWYPEALIPVSHPVTGKPLDGARFVAMPFDLPANQTHGFWVDLYVPARTKPGEYRGVYRVRSAEGQTAEVPVVLTVWGFDLPETPTMSAPR